MQSFGRAPPLPDYNKHRKPLTRRKAYITFGSAENITLQSNISHGIAVYHSDRVWASPTLNYSLFAFHYSLNKCVRLPHPAQKTPRQRITADGELIFKTLCFRFYQYNICRLNLNGHILSRTRISPAFLGYYLIVSERDFRLYHRIQHRSRFQF